MKKLLFYFLVLGVLIGCVRKSGQPVKTTDDKRKLIVTVVDYSKSYRGLVTLDSLSVQSLFHCAARTGGSIVHIGVQSYSNLPVHIARVEKLDTASTATTANIYEQARVRIRNGSIQSAHQAQMQQQVKSYLHETGTYEASSYTDLQYSLDLAKSTACEPVYTEGNRYERYVLILSDLLSDPPHRKSKQLIPADYCGATVLIVRPSLTIPADSLQKIFCGAPVHTFSNLPDAISFINQQ